MKSNDMGATFTKLHRFYIDALCQRLSTTIRR
jgi:hypothetical protein